LELNDKFDTSSRIIYKCHKIEEEAKNGFKTEKINKYFVTNTL
jgi:mRNA export factor